MIYIYIYDIYYDYLKYINLGSQSMGPMDWPLPWPLTTGATGGRGLQSRCCSLWQGGDAPGWPQAPFRVHAVGDDGDGSRWFSWTWTWLFCVGLEGKSGLILAVRHTRSQPWTDWCILDRICSRWILQIPNTSNTAQKSRGFTRLSDSGETSTNSSSCGRPQEWARPSPKKATWCIMMPSMSLACCTILYHPVLSCMLWCFLSWQHFWTQKKMEGVCQQHPDHGQRLEPRHGTVFLLAALLRCCTASHVRECYVNAGTMVTPTSCGTWNMKSGLGWVTFSFVMFTLSSSVRHLSFRHLLAFLFVW